MWILGITGGIATGKSTVTRLLHDLGAVTVSADLLARARLAPGTETTRAVLAAFPGVQDPACPEPTVDRRALGQIVFADSSARALLESLTHPGIVAALQAEIDRWRLLPSPHVGAAEIPLLFETHLEDRVDKIVVAACSEATQIARLMQRLGIGIEDARRQIAAQWPLAEKTARGDIVIDTDRTLEETQNQVAALWESLRERPKEPEIGHH